MKILFHYHTPAIQKGSGIYMPAYLGLFIDSIAKYYEEIILLLHLPNKKQKEITKYKLKSNNIKLVSLSVHSNIPHRYLLAPFFINKLFKLRNNVDNLLLRASTPYLPFVYLFWKKNTTLLFVSDANKGLDELNQNYLKLNLIKVWAHICNKFELSFAKKSNVIVNSYTLLEKFKKINKEVKLISTTTIEEKEIFYRKDTCLSSPYKLLFSGRISRNKGIFDLIGALYILRQKGFEVNLNIVGFFENDRLKDELKSTISKLNLNSFISIKGFFNAGPQLLKWYRNSDIFVMPTRSEGEGFPRVIWEAMASSLPVLATDLPGIKEKVNDSIKTFQKCSPEEIAKAITFVIENKKYRQELIIKGVNSVKEITLEKQAKIISKIIQS
ncbi:MAG: glycosyltransferase [Prochlorococcus marinus CUG1435]|nr:glycosyltransferase [Prochlorococcus marinus CUG1435]